MLNRPRAFAAAHSFEWHRPCCAANLLTAAVLSAMLLMAACASSSAVNNAPSAPFPDEPPPLPFDDNPDPTLCGIPVQDNRRGIVHGEFEGQLVTPIVYLHESHLRQTVTGQIFPNTEVEIRLNQSNPTLDYYFVKTVNTQPPQEGWIAAPFVTIKQ